MLESKYRKCSGSAGKYANSPLGLFVCCRSGSAGARVDRALPLKRTSLISGRTFIGLISCAKPQPLPPWRPLVTHYKLYKQLNRLAEKCKTIRLAWYPSTRSRGRPRLTIIKRKWMKGGGGSSNNPSQTFQFDVPPKFNWGNHFNWPNREIDQVNESDIVVGHSRKLSLW